MITVCYAAKGGTGTTVVAASLALALTPPVVLVDLGGDLPAALGVPDPDGPGVVDWVGSDAPSGRLAMLEVAIASGVSLLPRGSITGLTPTSIDERDGPAAKRWLELARWAAGDPRLGTARDVVVDGGSRGLATPGAAAVAAGADRRLLITRPCYLALRAAARLPLAPTAIVLVEEPGRSLGARDIEASLGAPVVATVLLDPAVARAVDAGLLSARVPHGFRRAMRSAA